MSLLDTIQAASLSARKARNTDEAALLTTLFAEAARVGKDDGNRVSTDAEVQEVVRKFIKNNNDTIQALWIPEKIDLDEARVARRTKLQLEQAVLMSFLPKQAAPEELQAAVSEIVAALPDKSTKHMGAVMGQLNKRFGANFDKRFASELVKHALQ
ncbi:glutamyl-tRNA amidotransferase [Novimethylophilus kurashikiensis]|uniref:Glutamyl-tRNA amidotransferase n=1 Tax=Novimethylophilus kurashikiensis TaxID=1825523 RepID=A0A2R5F7U5_9PROT|nr:GatB/YqeY domain-containing protein [Novimethylophilus kurashikiensis]GBG14312.1 glutamyl-tRNA amidotransferase [Novimethylophilus kurashikiensis]